MSVSFFRLKRETDRKAIISYNTTTTSQGQTEFYWKYTRQDMVELKQYTEVVLQKYVKLSKSEIYFADHQMVGWCLVFMFTLVVTPVVTEIIVCSATITNIIPRAPSQPASQRAEESCLFVSFSQLWLWLWLATIA